MSKGLGGEDTQAHSGDFKQSDSLCRAFLLRTHGRQGFGDNR